MIENIIFSNCDKFYLSLKWNETNLFESARQETKTLSFTVWYLVIFCSHTAQMDGQHALTPRQQRTGGLWVFLSQLHCFSSYYCRGWKLHHLFSSVFLLAVCVTEGFWSLTCGSGLWTFWRPLFTFLLTWSKNEKEAQSCHLKGENWSCNNNNINNNLYLIMMWSFLFFSAIIALNT